MITAEMTLTVIDRFYEATNALMDANPATCSNHYQFLLTCGQWQDHPNLKLMASKEIIKHFKLFPNLNERALDAVLDLCEDESPTVCPFNLD